MLNANDYTCNFTSTRNLINNQAYSLFGDGDTISQDDRVRRQYSLLPYPIESRDSYIREKNHYNSKKGKTPYLMYPSIKLENVNHFLYKGNNDFS